MCKKFEIEHDCFKNEHFEKFEKDTHPWQLTTPELTTRNYSCADGYCSCDAYGD